MKNSGMHAAIRELGTLFNEGAVGMLSDGQLLDRFVERRDASAFEAIVERYGPLVWGVCRRVLRDHHDAEDAFQATFLVLARKAASVMPREKLGNWLYGVAFQTAMKARATRAKRRVRERPAWEMTEPEAVPDEHADELLSRLDREVTRLPEKYRMPIILCELEGKTHRQAAEQLGWPVGTVSGRLSRARALLASRLSRPGTPLTVGALGVLLAHDVARAGVPPELVRSTAQAASLSMAGKAVTAGVVSARGRCPDRRGIEDHVAQQAQAHHGDAPGRRRSRRRRDKPHLPGASERACDPEGRFSEAQGASKTGEDGQNRKCGAKGDEPKRTETRGENFQHARTAELHVDGITTKASPFDDNSESSRQGKVDCGDYSFMALRTGAAVLAFNAATREVKALRLHAATEDQLTVTPVAIGFPDNQTIALAVKGARIARVGVFNFRLNKWTPLVFDEPTSGTVWPMAFGSDTVAYEIGDFLYLYNHRTDVWDRLDLRKIVDETEEPAATKGK